MPPQSCTTMAREPRNAKVAPPYGGSNSRVSRAGPIEFCQPATSAFGAVYTNRRENSREDINLFVLDFFPGPWEWTHAAPLGEELLPVPEFVLLSY